MKFKLVGIVLVLFFMQPVFANKINKPDTCPSIASLQNIEIQSASYDDFGGWLGLNHRNKYDTPEEWTFGILIGDVADNEVDAMVKAAAMIKSLTSVTGPIQKDDGTDRWGCLYASDDGSAMGFALTPAEDSLRQMLTEVKHY